MELIKLTHENMEKEHICCAISNNKDIQVMSKKNWLRERHFWCGFRNGSWADYFLSSGNTLFMALQNHPF